MRIGIIIGRIGGVDGVALETEKWIKVLERQGHEVRILTGRLQRNIDHVSIVPELDFHHPLVVREQDDAFFVQRTAEDVIIKRLDRFTDYLENQMLTWIVRHKIDVLLIENASALPCHLCMGRAIKNIIERTGIHCATHDHDFAWERHSRYKSDSPFIKDIIKDCFPLQLPNVRHAVINSYGKKTLKEKFGIHSMVVPNVMDFNQKFAVQDDYNSTLFKSLKLKPTDIPLFQITRIVKRKGIEVAIKLIKELDDPNVKLVITGGVDDDYNASYYGELIDSIEDWDLRSKVIFASDYFSTDRKIGKHMVDDLSKKEIKKAGNRKRRYSLEDAYAHARGCTYFSTYEGFGNAFLEAVLAKKPIWVNNYQPVYWPDIGSLGFKTVMLEDNQLTSKAVEQIKEVIYDEKKAKEIAEHNFKLGKKYFSFEVLEQLLDKLFSGI